MRTQLCGCGCIFPQRNCDLSGIVPAVPQVPVTAARASMVFCLPVWVASSPGMPSLRSYYGFKLSPAFFVQFFVEPRAVCTAIGCPISSWTACTSWRRREKLSRWCTMKLWKRSQRARGSHPPASGKRNKGETPSCGSLA